MGGCVSALSGCYRAIHTQALTFYPGTTVPRYPPAYMVADLARLVGRELGWSVELFASPVNWHVRVNGYCMSASTFWRFLAPKYGGVV